MVCIQLSCSVFGQNLFAGAQVNHLVTELYMHLLGSGLWHLCLHNLFSHIITVLAEEFEKYLTSPDVTLTYIIYSVHIINVDV